MVKKVYESNLSTDLKKFIVDKNLGFIEKNKIQQKLTIKTDRFKNYNEAFYYQTKLNKGEIYSINEEETEPIN